MYLCIMYVCMYVCVCMYYYVSMYVRTYVIMNTCTDYVWMCTYVLMYVYILCMYTYVCTFPRSVLREICAFVFQWRRANAQHKTFLVCLPSSVPGRSQFHVNCGIEVWDEECLNDPLVVDVARVWSNMTSPQMCIRWGSGPMLIPSSAGKEELCQRSVTNQLLTLYSKWSLMLKLLILTICPNMFTCNITANISSEICTSPMLIRILRVVTLSGRVANW
jgi:hypothetical protein